MVRLLVKSCTGCRRELPATREYFHAHAPSGDGLKPRCKDCRRAEEHARYSATDESRAAAIARARRWERANRHRKNRMFRRWCLNNRLRRQQIKANYHQRKKASDPSYRLSMNVSRAINYSLHGRKGGRRWQELVGYTVEQLKAHLEAQFHPGMSWDNYGEWHIDHRRPIASFTITAADDPALRECWSLSNLQPLWAQDNLTKWAKWAS